MSRVFFGFSTLFRGFKSGLLAWPLLHQRMQYPYSRTLASICCGLVTCLQNKDGHKLKTDALCVRTDYLPLGVVEQSSRHAVHLVALFILEASTHTNTYSKCSSQFVRANNAFSNIKTTFLSFSKKPETRSTYLWHFIVACISGHAREVNRISMITALLTRRKRGGFYQNNVSSTLAFIQRSRY